MPAAIGTAIATWLASITVTQVVFTIASLAISSAMSSRAQKKAEAAQRAAAEQQRAAYNAGLVDRTSVLRTGIQPRNMILGRDEASGPLVCWFTYGPLRNFHAFAVVLAGHECDEVETVMFNHEPVTLDGSGAVVAPDKYLRVVSHNFTTAFPGGPAGTTCVLIDAPARVDSVRSYRDGVYLNTIGYTVVGNVLTTTQDVDPDPDGNILDLQVTYTVVVRQPLFYIKKYLGAPGQTAAPELIAAAAQAGIPTAWDATRKGTGICYLTCVVEADFNVLGQIGIPNLSAVTRGAKAYDPRTGLTAWTQNPPVLARWFNVDSGFAPKTLSSEINADELLASANVSDEAVSFSATEVGARYTCNGQLTCAATPLDNFNHILDAMDGDAVWISGQWQIVAGYYKEPTLDIDEDTLDSAAISILPRTAKRDLFNGIKGQFVDASNGYIRTGYGLITSDFYKAQDGDESLPAEANFELVNDSRRCQMIAWQRLTRARQPLTLQLGTTLKGYDSAPLQTINVNLRRPGYVNKVFTNLRREHDKNTLTYTLQETGPEVWEWDYSKASAAVDLPNSSLPDAITIPVVTDVVAESGTNVLQRLGDGTIISRVRLSWAAVTNIYVLNGGKIEWQHKSAADTSDDWEVLPPSRGEDVEAFTGALVDGDVRLFRGRCVTMLGRKGDWCPLVVHRVVGKTAPPSDVLFFTINGTSLAWSAVTDVDLAGYQVRFNYSQNRAWGTATPLHIGLVTESPWTPEILPPGQVTLLIKAIDTSGNESANAAPIVTNLGDPIVINLIDEYDDKAAGFPGVKVNGTVSGGDLVADDSGGLFWGQDTGNYWKEDAALVWPGSTYLQMVYTTTYRVGADQRGARLTLQVEVEGESYTIEYCYTTQGLYWGPDDAYAWGADSDLYWPAATDRATWPGAIENISEGDIELRITTQAGSVRGAIRELTLQIDVEDELEYVNDAVIAAIGTRLPLTKSFRSIKNVLVTLQAAPGGADSYKVLDKVVAGSSGPLIGVYAAGVGTTGLIDAQIQGVKGN
ncbi:hypothetical protein PMI15_04686 [Polaromonas sp. CF318]|uniref:hypothetical protein n=1 Tax=Polaromonas sp. CF318 TaxID=1144318 RepID=UPI0002714523|nr:hypothetical protein [Polaromonas sp. CF318]EJL77364.1 hypothetical protein PMI15_04686 [Polaromonas sp. CF318]